MRRRNPGRVREELAAEYRRTADLYGEVEPRLGQFADRIEAGEPVEVHGFEVGLPHLAWVRVEADGRVVPLDEVAS